MLVARPLGPYAWLFWLMLACNVLTPQLFWSARLRTSGPVLFLASLAILLGMWLERFIIIVASLNRDFLPSAWHFYAPSWVDLSILGGSICFFTLLFLLFIRFVPFIPISELRELRHELASEPG
jgi:molybdopterin-containing oxidoreductase family membrane subunit